MEFSDLHANAYYRNVKNGKSYQLICVAKHSETLEDVVVYRGGVDFWVRPVALFLEKFVPWNTPG